MYNITNSFESNDIHNIMKESIANNKDPIFKHLGDEYRSLLFQRINHHLFLVFLRN